MTSTQVGLAERLFVAEKSGLTKRKISAKIWSNIKELSETLLIPFSSNTICDPEECRFQHVRFEAGQYIHRNRQVFESLYIVNSGFLKTVHLDDLHNDQILSFPMKGDVLGIDGIYTRKYASDAIALTTCDVIVLPYRYLQTVTSHYVDFDNLLFAVMSRDLERKQSHLCLIGSTCSEARVAQFLIRLAERYAELGYSANCFELRMARHEIGSYLGLTLETVSRTLTLLDDLGLITVARRSITINDHHALRTMRKLQPLEGKKQARHAAMPASPSTLLSTNNPFLTLSIPDVMLN